MADTRGLVCAKCGSRIPQPINGKGGALTCSVCGAIVRGPSPEARQNPPETAQGLYARAMELLRQKKYDTAADVFSEAISRAPDFAMAYWGRCQANRHTDNENEALRRNLINTLVDRMNQSGDYSATVDEKTARDTVFSYFGKDLDAAVSVARQRNAATGWDPDHIHLQCIVDGLAGDTLRTYMESKYQYAVEKQNTKKYEDQMIALDRFSSLGNYKDSAERCRELTGKTRSTLYAMSRASLKAGETGDKARELEKAFRSLGGYKLSRAYAHASKKAYKLVKFNKVVYGFFTALMILTGLAFAAFSVWWFFFVLNYNDLENVVVTLPYYDVVSVYLPWLKYGNTDSEFLAYLMTGIYFLIPYLSFSLVSAVLVPFCGRNSLRIEKLVGALIAGCGATALCLIIQTFIGGKVWEGIVSIILWPLLTFIIGAILSIPFLLLSYFVSKIRILLIGR